MSRFDSVARDWDKDQMHIDRSIVIASELEKTIPLNKSMKALEYGAGTGFLSFLLKEKFSEITLMDSSGEMIKVCQEKVDYYGTKHIKPLYFDLEHNNYDQKVDVIYNLMVLHHVNEVEALLIKFYTMLNSGGYLAIADLYAEDGSFHGPDVKVHWGFNPEKLHETLTSVGFKHIEYKPVFEIKRESGRVYPIFLFVAKK